ncbi:ArsR/SmtB family transcription factor [Mucilaginibacter pocheonensis]|uniref:DNA-binding transcriptional ArsR family regulator n=1 Tax=Mucilaginibacter pocheonensis TaxID=398050 RepID=A0ABU1T5U5_9SPHI|nr:metalloregulator ArsR/SmtB family transcription factor [Mucilaginibacter pocheonensis]MDR6940762.1 DNA-binding transcriptional ArsR family regulator [Mucilaginibacter pocheonensis]
MRTNTDPFQALADPGRRAILMMLSQNRQSINTIAGNFDISRPAVSKHIKVLYEAGLVQIKDSGRERYCELNPDGFNEVKKWLDYFDQFWRTKLQNLEDLLNQQHKTK